MTHALRRIGAVLVSVALSGLAVSTAYAEDPGAQPTPTTTASAPAQLVDAKQPVTLTIHKYQGDPGDKTKGLAGVSFKVERINVDLTTQAGWTTLSGMTGANATVDTSWAAKTLTTTTDGTVSISTGSDPTFTVGAYKVTEIQKGGYSVAPPFIVTLPHGESGSWNYTQTVEPKNQVIQPNKQVDATNTTVGTTQTYTVNAPVPAGELTTFVITDPLNAANLTLQAGATVKAGTVTGATNDGAVALTPTADYTLTEDTASNTVTVTFTTTGLKKLQDARVGNANLQVSLAFKATVKAVPANGVITNTATVTIPNGSVNTDVVVYGADGSVQSTTPTSTTFANVVITKTGTPTGDMTGAQFQLYICKETAPGSGKWTLIGTPVQVAAATDGTPGDTITVAAGPDGKADTAQGFHIPVQTFAGGTTGTKDMTNSYCALETKAPAGYIPNPEPQHLSFTAGSNAEGTLATTINNQKDTILGQLPATGAWGLLIVLLLGGGLILRGVIASRRDDEDEATA